MASSPKSGEIFCGKAAPRNYRVFENLLIQEARLFFSQSLLLKYSFLYFSLW